VKDLIEDDGCLAIVRAVIGLGKSFGITTTAEGVETEQQLQRLALEGCTEAQGYLYSMPLPADQVPALLAEITRRRLAFEVMNLS
jgi:EAL domain-containing protein (putative c-di-GMP-specific phosphodiesterase class I)